MKQYQLQPTEVVLYETENITLKGEKGSTTLALTNCNFVFETTVKKLLCKNYTTTECFALDTVKIYNNAPQIKQKDFEVQIYFKNAERHIVFINKKEAHKFVSKALELLTGKTAFVRGVEKVKEKVAVIDETLGINTVEIASTVAKTAIQGAATVAPGRKFSKATTTVLTLANGMIQKKETKQITETPTTEDNIEILKKLKALLDDGTITQEEFDKKKKELLSL